MATSVILRGELVEIGSSSRGRLTRNTEATTSPPPPLTGAKQWGRFFRSWSLKSLIWKEKRRRRCPSDGSSELSNDTDICGLFERHHGLVFGSISWDLVKNT